MRRRVGDGVRMRVARGVRDRATAERPRGRRAGGVRFDRDATGATGEVCGGRVLVPLGPREDTHEVQMRFEA
jgi:hypothetical protein